MEKLSNETLDAVRGVLNSLDTVMGVRIPPMFLATLNEVLDNLAAMTRERDAARAELATAHDAKREAERKELEALAELDEARAALAALHDDGMLPVKGSVHVKIVTRLYVDLAVAKRERESTKAQLDNVLDTSKEGGWMARALDAKRELESATGRAEAAERESRAERDASCVRKQDPAREPGGPAAPARSGYAIGAGEPPAAVEVGGHEQVGQQTRRKIP